MSETTGTTTNSSGRTPAEQATWDQAVAASAEAQKPDDPPPRYFIEELDVVLSAMQQLEAGKQHVQATRVIAAFDLKTKALASERKVERAKLLAKVEDYASQTDTGRIKKKIRCAEYTSFSQNRKYKVRLDRPTGEGTWEEISEVPLSTAERQGKLPLVEDKSDDELSGSDVSAADDNDEEDEELEDEEADEDEDLDEPSSSETITDPAAVMSGKGVQPTLPSVASVTPIKRSAKAKASKKPKAD